MVTYFNKKDLVSFGEYLLSDERKTLVQERVVEMTDIPSGRIGPSYEHLAKSVTLGDIENWKIKRKS